MAPDTKEVKIQVIFKTTTAYGDYQDALWFSQAEHDALTPEVFEAKKQERIDKWIAIVSAPPLEISKEDRLKDINDRIAKTESMLSQLLEEKSITNKEIV